MSKEIPTDIDTGPLEELKKKSEEAWKEYYKLSGPAQAAHKAAKAADAAHRDAVLYAKIRRRVIRDMLDAAEKEL